MIGEVWAMIAILSVSRSLSENGQDTIFSIASVRLPAEHPEEPALVEHEDLLIFLDTV
jgi:hypothetical protein